MITTKDQERKALAQIQKIVASLGENSYIATAFDGCFEIAAENIENDFACSLKQQLDAANAEIITLQDRNNTLQRFIDRRDAIIKKHDDIHAAEMKNLSDCLQATARKVLSADDMTDCKQLVADAAYDTESAVKAAAADIVKFADNPAGADFQNAVKTHRAMSDKLEYLSALHERISAIVDGTREY